MPVLPLQVDARGLPGGRRSRSGSHSAGRPACHRSAATATEGRRSPPRCPDIRITLARLSERAAAQSRKCCAMTTRQRNRSRDPADRIIPKVQAENTWWQLIHKAGVSGPSRMCGRTGPASHFRPGRARWQTPDAFFHRPVRPGSKPGASNVGRGGASGPLRIPRHNLCLGNVHFSMERRSRHRR